MTEQEMINRIAELEQQNEELLFIVRNSGRAVVMVDEMLGISQGFDIVKLGMKLPILIQKAKKDPSLFGFLTDENFQSLIKKYANPDTDK